VNYQEQNDALLENFLNRTFFRSWCADDSRRLQNFTRAEVILTSECNLACKYCYLNRFGEQLYPEEVRDRDTILKNLDLLLDWMIKNRYTPQIDFFSGDPLSQQVGLDALKLIAQKYKDVPKKYRLEGVGIPTNYTFLLDDGLVAEVEALIETYKELGMHFHLSASVDGKHIENNRPMIPKKHLPEDFLVGKQQRGDEFYDDLFEFSQKHKFGFHPMIYSEGIEDWKDNFLWFQDNFRRVGIPFYNIYLLEVRNVEWTERQIGVFYRFIKFLTYWTFENPCRGDRDLFMNFLFNFRGFNILANTFTRIGRGIGCSFQSMLYFRLGDLHIVPCHRTMYEGNSYGRMVVQDNEITGIEAINPELCIQGFSLDAEAFPMCQSCAIKVFCSKGCLGSQIEVNRDQFSPIPTVCKLEHAKVKALFEAFDDIGVLGHVTDVRQDRRRNAILAVRRLLNE